MSQIPWKFDHVNLAKPQRMMGSMFGGILSFMLLMFTLNGAMYAAVDITAGEKERRRWRFCFRALHDGKRLLSQRCSRPRASVSRLLF